MEILFIKKMDGDSSPTVQRYFGTVKGSAATYAITFSLFLLTMDDNERFLPHCSQDGWELGLDQLVRLLTYNLSTQIQLPFLLQCQEISFFSWDGVEKTLGSKGHDGNKNSMDLVASTDCNKFHGAAENDKGGTKAEPTSLGIYPHTFLSLNRSLMDERALVLRLLCHFWLVGSLIVTARRVCVAKKGVKQRALMHGPSLLYIIQ
jgi:hypothetical protein